MSEHTNGNTNGRIDELKQGQLPEHHIHHAQGDIGGTYADQPEEGGPHPEAFRVGEIVKEQTIEEEEREFEINEREARLRKERISTPEEKKPILIVVMGVSASGKSTVGASLAHALCLPFIDADDLHPKTNVDKMSKGIPLTDEDRAPWLVRIRSEALRICTEQESGEKHEHNHTQSNGTTNSTATNATNGTDDTEHALKALHRPCKGVVVGCSALKRHYRDTLRGLHARSSEEQESTLNGVTSDNASSDANSKIERDLGPETQSELELPTYFVFISGTREALLERISQRKGHFFKSSMLDSQLSTLEPPNETGEGGVVTIPLETTLEEQVKLAREGLKGLGIDI
ncbi:carbohydrate kinase [Pyrrhoderma noxium]|uniref:gluconokinase n=1 Tax=Pyrrhoderma noxium TaxID=2282107 RepID=A0A286UHS0_9AGAM|nr:carbohydrate kinase [Pyrrhoderma noxium]